MRFARLFAKQKWSSIGHNLIEFEDLEQAAYIGLVQAVDTFDADSGKSLRNWIVIKVRGAMLDFLREVDPLTRQQRLNGDETPAFIALENEEGIPLPFSDAGPGPDVQAMAAELRDRVEELPRRLREMTIAHYWRGHTLARIARAHGISEGRVSQLLEQARRKLHEYLSHAPVAVPTDAAAQSRSGSGLRLRRVLQAAPRRQRRVVAIEQRAAGRAAGKPAFFLASVRAVVRAGRSWQRVAA